MLCVLLSAVCFEVVNLVVKLWSDAASERFLQKSSAISCLLVECVFVLGLRMQWMCFWGLSPQNLRILLQILLGGVSGAICSVNCLVQFFLDFFRLNLKSALAFLNCMMFSVVISLFSLCHLLFLSSLSICSSLFHQGTLWGRIIGCVWGIVLCALDMIILCIVAASLFMFVLFGICRESSSVNFENCSQFALSVIKLGLAVVCCVFVVVEVNRDIRIGKWSLPLRSSSVCHVLSICSIGLLKVRSMFVSVLCVLRCVGEPSFSKM